MNRVSGYSSLHLISSHSSAIFDLLVHVPSDGGIGGAPGPSSMGVWRAQGAWPLLLLRRLDLRGEHRVALLLCSIRGVGERALILRHHLVDVESFGRRGILCSDWMYLQTTPHPHTHVAPMVTRVHWLL